MMMEMVSGRTTHGKTRQTEKTQLATKTEKNKGNSALCCLSPASPGVCPGCNPRNNCGACSLADVEEAGYYGWKY